MKKKEIIRLIELMICKYEVALKLNELETSPNKCPLCIGTTLTGYTRVEDIDCNKCILTGGLDRNHTYGCINAISFGLILTNRYAGLEIEKPYWAMRLKFWETALYEIKQIWQGSFFLNISNIAKKLRKIDVELWERNNKF